MGAYFSPERITRKLVADIARVAHAESRRYAFTLHSGRGARRAQRAAARHPLLPGGRSGAHRRARSAFGRATARATCYLMTPYDQGVFHAPIVKSGVLVVSLPQLYADLYHYERRGREQAAHLRREAMGY